MIANVLNLLRSVQNLMNILVRTFVEYTHSIGFAVLIDLTLYKTIFLTYFNTNRVNSCVYRKMIFKFWFYVSEPSEANISVNNCFVFI